MSDDFNSRYRLLKCVAVDDGIRTHNAQELATGRVVMVHLADAAGPEDVERLRSQLGRLTGGDKNRVLETATLPSGFAIVTEFLTGLGSFPTWLAQRAGGAGAGGASAMAPAVTEQVTQPIVVPPVAETAGPPTAVTETGVPAAAVAGVSMIDVPVSAPPAPAMTTPVAATPTEAIPPMAPPPVFAPPAAPEPARAPGAFTQMFGAPSVPANVPASAPVAPPSAPATAPPVAQPAARRRPQPGCGCGAAKAPGAFTQMFERPVFRPRRRRHRPGSGGGLAIRSPRHPASGSSSGSPADSTGGAPDHRADHAAVDALGCPAGAHCDASRRSRTGSHAGRSGRAAGPGAGQRTRCVHADVRRAECPKSAACCAEFCAIIEPAAEHFSANDSIIRAVDALRAWRIHPDVLGAGHGRATPSDHAGFAGGPTGRAARLATGCRNGHASGTATDAGSCAIVRRRTISPEQSGCRRGRSGIAVRAPGSDQRAGVSVHARSTRADGFGTVPLGFAGKSAGWQSGHSAAADFCGRQQYAVVSTGRGATHRRTGGGRPQ